MVRTQIQLSEEQARALKEVAARRGVSVAQLVRQGVDAVLREREEAPREQRLRRALEASGRFRSGRGDLSEKHDEYLDEAFRS